MICLLTKWFVSRELDEGKQLPAFARRHVASCGNCGSFSSISAKMGQRLASEPVRLPDQEGIMFWPSRLVLAAASAVAILVAMMLAVSLSVKKAEVSPVVRLEAETLYPAVSVEEVQRYAALVAKPADIRAEMNSLTLDAIDAARFLAGNVNVFGP